MAKTKTKQKPRNSRTKLVQAIKNTKVLPRPAKKIATSAVGMIDQRILDLATKQYDKVRKQISRNKAKLDFEGRLAIELGERILNRAKEVRTSLMPNKKVAKKTGSAPQVTRH